jgi:hypothetical protein
MTVRRVHDPSPNGRPCCDSVPCLGWVKHAAGFHHAIADVGHPIDEAGRLLRSRILFGCTDGSSLAGRRCVGREFKRAAIRRDFRSRPCAAHMGWAISYTYPTRPLERHADRRLVALLGLGRSRNSLWMLVYQLVPAYRQSFARWDVTIAMLINTVVVLVLCAAGFFLVGWLMRAFARRGVS